MHSFSQWLNNISLRLNAYVAIVLGGIIILMFVILFMQVCFRYLFNHPLSWPEECAMFLMAWMTFLGSSVAVRMSSHIGIDYVPNKLHGRAKKILLLGINLCVLGFSLALLVEGLHLTAESEYLLSEGMRIPMIYPRLSMPIGGALMAFHAFTMLLVLCAGKAEEDNGK